MTATHLYFLEHLHHGKTGANPFACSHGSRENLQVRPASPAACSAGKRGTRQPCPACSQHCPATMGLSLWDKDTTRIQPCRAEGTACILR